MGFTWQPTFRLSSCLLQRPFHWGSYVGSSSRLEPAPARAPHTSPSDLFSAQLLIEGRKHLHQSLGQLKSEVRARIKRTASAWTTQTIKFCIVGRLMKWQCRMYGCACCVL